MTVDEQIDDILTIGRTRATVAIKKLLLQARIEELSKIFIYEYTPDGDKKSSAQLYIDDRIAELQATLTTKQDN